MTLDVGDIDRIDHPTAEQLEQLLRVPPPRAPYVTLTDDQGRQLQATLASAGERYRLEYREPAADRAWRATLAFDEALRALDRFRRGDASFRTAVAWRRHYAWNDPHSPVVLAAIGVPLLALVGWAIWEMLR